MTMAFLLKHRTLLVRLGQFLVISTSLLFLGSALYQNWGGIQNSTSNFDQRPFIVALSLLFVTWGILPFPTYVTLRAFSIPISLPQAMAAFHSSQAMKYLPGGIWAFPGRALIYTKEHNLDKRKSAFSVTWETLALLVAAMIVSLIGLLSNNQYTSTIRVMAFVILIGLFVPFIAPWQSTIRSLNRNYNSEKLLKITTFLDKTVQISAKVSLKSIAMCITFWLLNGIGFYFLLMSVLGMPLPYTWYEATSLFTIAWAVSFLVIVAPAGLGVRESVLVFLLSSSIEQGDAVFIAILARLWWTIVESIWIVLGILLYYHVYRQ